MDFINKILDTILKNSGKNIIISILLLLTVCLNILGVDIKYISNINNISLVLLLSNVLILLASIGFMFSEISKMKKISDETKGLADISEKTKDTIDNIESYIRRLKEDHDKLTVICNNIATEISNVPNLKYIRFVIELRLNSLWYEIIIECIKYVLTATGSSYEVVKTNFENNIAEINKKLKKFVNKNIKAYDGNEVLSIQLSAEVGDKTNLILIELEKNRSPIEKIYVITLILKEVHDDMMKIVDEYLQDMHAKYLKD